MSAGLRNAAREGEIAPAPKILGKQDSLFVHEKIKTEKKENEQDSLDRTKVKDDQIRSRQ